MLPMLLLLAIFVLVVFSTAISWYLQIGHYPLLDSVGRKEFHDYIKLHNKRRPYLVRLPALLATLVALLLIAFPPFGINLWVLYLQEALLLAVLALTFLALQPHYTQLSYHGYSPSAFKRLRLLQWSRTLLWSLSTFVVLYLMLRVLGIVNPLSLPF